MPTPNRSRPPLSEGQRAAFRRAVWLGLGLLVGGAIAHIGYWYLPRPTPVSAAESRLLPRFGSGDLVVWVPRPHQNLPALAELVSSPAEVARALLRLAGRSDRSLPGAGPFGIPPAHELAVGTGGGAGSSSALVAVRPYPTIRWIARSAGALAGNPWLEGGEVEADGGVVTWDRGSWWWGPSGPPGGAGATAVIESRRRVLARLQVPPGLPLPAGGYGLVPSATGLRLVSDREVEAPPLTLLAEIPDLALVLRTSEEPFTLLLLFGGELRRGELPSAVAVSPDPRVAYERLPGGGLLPDLEDLPTARLGNLVVIATDRNGLERARASQDRWEPLAAAEAGSDAGGFWVDLDRAETLCSALADLLADVPLVSPREAAHWRDRAIVLGGLERFRTASGWWTADGGELRLDAGPVVAPGSR